MATVLGRSTATGQVKLRLSDGSQVYAKWQGNSEPAAGSSVQYDAKSNTANGKVALAPGYIPRALSRWEQPQFTTDKDRNDVYYAGGELWDIDKPAKKRTAGNAIAMFFATDLTGANAVYAGGASDEPVLLTSLQPGLFVSAGLSSIHLDESGTYTAGVAVLDFNQFTVELRKCVGSLLTEDAPAVSVEAVYDLQYLSKVRYFGFARWQILSKGFPLAPHFELTNPPDPVNGGVIGQDLCGLGTSGTSATASLLSNKPIGFIPISVVGSGTRTNASELKYVQGGVCQQSSSIADLGKTCNEGSGSSSQNVLGTFVAKSTSLSTIAASANFSTGLYALTQQTADADKAVLVQGGAGPICEGEDADNYIRSGCTATLSYNTLLLSDYAVASTESYNRPYSSSVTSCATLSYTDRLISASTSESSSVVYTDSGTETYDQFFDFDIWKIPGQVSFAVPPTSTKTVQFISTEAGQQTAVELAVPEAIAQTLTSKESNLRGGLHAIVTSYDLLTGRVLANVTDLADPTSAEEVELEIETIDSNQFSGELSLISTSYSPLGQS